MKAGKLKLPDSFSKISAQGIDFIARLLVVNKSARMPSQEAVGHAWLNEAFDSSGELPVGRLKYFCSRRRWQVCIIAYYYLCLNQSFVLFTPMLQVCSVVYIFPYQIIRGTKY